MVRRQLVELARSAPPSTAPQTATLSLSDHPPASAADILFRSTWPDLALALPPLAVRTGTRLPGIDLARRRRTRDETDPTAATLRPTESKKQQGRGRDTTTGVNATGEAGEDGTRGRVGAGAGRIPER